MSKVGFLLQMIRPLPLALLLLPLVHDLHLQKIGPLPLVLLLLLHTFLLLLLSHQSRLQKRDPRAQISRLISMGAAVVRLIRHALHLGMNRVVDMRIAVFYSEMSFSIHDVLEYTKRSLLDQRNRIQ